jgi:putative cardiolipin synthase
MAVPIGALAGRRHQAGSLEALRSELAAFVETQRESAYVRSARTTAAERLAAGSRGWYWGRTLLVVDDPAKVGRAPEDTEGHLLPQLGAVARQMKSELLIVSPYFVPGEAGVAWLRSVTARGIRVTILTNSLAATDVGAVHAGYKRYRDALLDAGVQLHEFKPGAIDYERGKGEGRRDRDGVGGSSASLHAKTFIFDRRAVFIGSLNLDPRSTQLNTEIGVVCESELMAHALADGLTTALDQVAWRVEKVAEPGGAPRLVWVESTASGPVQLRDEPQASAWRRFSVWFLGLLPIESQL